ncbi:metal ABC transporter substrate-binding protein [Kiritimatiellota bacterium B12222]|nr:metal ABC transporter substrate-binding protein [Kiritimatiellota bacterium B12222]
MKKISLLLFLSLVTQLWAADKPLVVTLHPILTEMVTDLVGDEVQVEGILPQGANVHSFEPSPQDMVEMQNAVLIVAMGKHLEPYLDRLKENLPPTVKIYEAGRLVPSLQSDPSTAMFACCPVHGLAAIDPHWWQSPEAVRRAVRHLGRELEKVFPEYKSEIRANTKVRMDELKELDRWAEEELAAVPKADRELVTTHTAFGYFCARYQFQAVPVRGVNNDKDPNPEELASTLKVLRDRDVKALFPESSASADSLRAIHETSGIPLAKPLDPEFSFEENSDRGYDEVFRQNVLRIKEALISSDSQ